MIQEKELEAIAAKDAALQKEMALQNGLQQQVNNLSELTYLN